MHDDDALMYGIDDRQPIATTLEGKDTDPAALLAAADRDDTDDAIL